MLLATLPHGSTNRYGASPSSSTARGCTVRDLLTLGLGPVHLARAGLAPVSCVVPTELPNPTAVVRRGALVLTCGKHLTDPGSQSGFVTQLSDAGASCIGWTTEASQGSAKVPPAVVEAARAAGLTVVSIPSHVAFSEIADLVASHLSPTRPAAIAETEQLCQLLESATAGLGLQATITRVSQVVGRPIRVVGLDGSVIAGYPPEAAAREGRTREPSSPLGLDARHPIVVDGVVRAHLVTTPSDGMHPVLRFASALAGLELGRLLADAASTRQVLGQVIEDIADRVLSDSEARRRLGRLGVSADGKHTVLLATADTESPSDMIAAVLPLHRCDIVDEPEGRRPLVGLINSTVCVLAPGEWDSDALARRVHTAMSTQHREVRVGVGGSLSGIPGLRTSYLEAREGLTRGIGLNPRRALTLAGLLAAQEQTALTELAQEALGPIIDADARAQSDLLATLRTLLETDFSVARTAEALFVHRNTVKYRISQIERLSGMSLSSTADRAQMWVAVSALGGAR